MFAEPPPIAEPPAISTQQQSDLDCLSIGAVLANSTRGSGPIPLGTPGWSGSTSAGCGAATHRGSGCR